MVYNIRSGVCRFELCRRRIDGLSRISGFLDAMSGNRYIPANTPNGITGSTRQGKARGCAKEKESFQCSIHSDVQS